MITPNEYTQIKHLIGQYKYRANQTRRSKARAKSVSTRIDKLIKWFDLAKGQIPHYEQQAFKEIMKNYHKQKTT